MVTWDDGLEVGTTGTSRDGQSPGVVNDKGDGPYESTVNTEVKRIQRRVYKEDGSPEKTESDLIEGSGDRNKK